MSELKPCPFCGGEAVVERFFTSRRSAIVACTQCGCTVEGPEVDVWNRRATPTESREQEPVGIRLEMQDGEGWKDVGQATTMDGLHFLIHDYAGMPNPIRTTPTESREREAIRPEVLAFARIMEAKLRAHDDRPGWKEDQVGALLLRAIEELDEVRDAWQTGRSSKEMAAEAADVANFAMMIADVSGGLAILGGEDET